jgi:hypothetical protein
MGMRRTYSNPDPHGATEGGDIHRGRRYKLLTWDPKWLKYMTFTHLPLFFGNPASTTAESVAFQFNFMIVSLDADK